MSEQEKLKDILWIYNKLKDIIKENKYYHTRLSCEAWRYSGALEIYLKDFGILRPGEKFTYLSRPKTICFLLDCGWTESYPEFIARKTKDFLNSKDLPN